MTDSLASRLLILPHTDRRLLQVLAAAALVALLLGVLGGAITGVARAGFLTLVPESAYRLLTLHGVTAFFYWLYLAQAGFLLIFAAAGNGAAGLAGRPAAWIGSILLLVGFVVSETTALTGPPLLYDGTPDLAGDAPEAVGLFSAGYLLLAAGLTGVAVSGIATVLAAETRTSPEACRNGERVQGWSSLSFALFAWAGFLLVSAIAAAHAFLPGALWAVGLGAFPADHATNWHILFHNLHYLPLMATVILWYVLVEALTGVRSIFGARFSKLVFAAYLIFVPPTSLYHMFLEPDLPETVRVVGSLLSLFVSVPTLTAFLIIVVSLEAHARTRGGTGLFGWMRHLPWTQPAMPAIAAAAVHMGLGLVFAFVLIQEKLAPLLSDTFFVPAYFHFFTVGTVTLTFLAGLSMVLPGLTGQPLRNPVRLARLPLLLSGGLLLFGGAGLAAGVLGVPRRVFDISYGGAAPPVWGVLMAVVGLGAVLMAVALVIYVLALLRLFLMHATHGTVDAPQAMETAVPQTTSLASSTAAWTGPLSVALLVGAMYIASTVAFEIMQRLPLLVSGGSGGGH